MPTSIHQSASARRRLSRIVPTVERLEVRRYLAADIAWLDHFELDDDDAFELAFASGNAQLAQLLALDAADDDDDHDDDDHESDDHDDFEDDDHFQPVVQVTTSQPAPVVSTDVPAVDDILIPPALDATTAVATPVLSVEAEGGSLTNEGTGLLPASQAPDDPIDVSESSVSSDGPASDQLTAEQVPEPASATVAPTDHGQTDPKLDTAGARELAAAYVEGIDTQPNETQSSSQADSTSQTGSESRDGFFARLGEVVEIDAQRLARRLATEGSVPGLALLSDAVSAPFRWATMAVGAEVAHVIGDVHYGAPLSRMMLDVVLANFRVGQTETTEGANAALPWSLPWQDVSPADAALVANTTVATALLTLLAKDHLAAKRREDDDRPASAETVVLPRGHSA